VGKTGTIIFEESELFAPSEITHENVEDPQEDLVSVGMSLPLCINRRQA
jgi:hypothetical protein